MMAASQPVTAENSQAVDSAAAEADALSYSPVIAMMNVRDVCSRSDLAHHITSHIREGVDFDCDPHLTT